MRFKLFERESLMIVFVLVVSLTLGIFGFNKAIASNQSNQSQTHAPVYQENENGQTYGSAVDATSIATEPDLIQAQGEDGTLGYILAKDLNGKLPKTPEEAVALTSENKKIGVKKVPLYAFDGKTVIGTFNLYPGELTEITSSVE